MDEIEPMQISVIVSCRNEIRHIRTFLGCLFHQDLRGLEMEVLIADGMSEDGSRAVLEEFDRKYTVLRVIDNPEKIAATGLNYALAEARGEIILRLDAHSIYAPDYIRTCVEVLQETNAENVGGPVLTRADGYMGRAIAYAYHSRFASGGSKCHDPHYEGPVETVTYGCWRRSTLDRIGPFDETLVRCQDTELNLRLIASGGTIWQSPRIVSWYCPRTSLRDLSFQYFQYGFWKFAVARKHGKLVSRRNFIPGLCFLTCVALLLCATAAGLARQVWWRDMFFATWLGLMGIYLVASFASSFLVALRKGWNYLPILPIVLAAYHLPYAIGFLLATFYRPETWDRSLSIRKVFEGLSR